MADTRNKMDINISHHSISANNILVKWFLHFFVAFYGFMMVFLMVLCSFKQCNDDWENPDDHM